MSPITGPAPLVSITRFEVQALSITPRAGFDDERPVECQVTTAFTAQRPENDEPSREFRAFLDLTFNAGQDEILNAPYEVRIGVLAYFLTPVDMGSDRSKVPARVINNALMIIYGIARGIVGQATAASTNQQFVLPTVTFDGLIAKSKVVFDDEKDTRTEIVASDEAEAAGRSTHEISD